MPVTPDLHGKFLHITDIHIDPHYQDEATIKSGCHRQAKKHHKKKKRKGKLAGYWGSPTSGCDAPPRLADHAIDWIADGWKDKIDFIIWTGDNARHDLDSKIPRTKKEILALNEAIKNKIQEAFYSENRTIPIIPCIGNNDVHPHNRLQSINMLEALSDMWSDLIPADQLATFRRGGYYAVDIGAGVRVLALNTLYFFDSNDAVKGCRQPGPGSEHFAWIRNQLESARRDRARVYMIGHVPPSPRTFYDSCLETYITISNEYRDVIAGHMYGHVNMDHFMVLEPSSVQDSAADSYVSKLRKQYRNARGNDSVIVHVAPPLLPVYNPAFRINEYDPNPQSPQFGTWTKYTQYYADLNYFNQLYQPEQHPPQFIVEYATDTEYGMKDLSPESWVDLARRMTEKSKGSKKLWRTFVDNLFVQTGH
ncbi:Metallo-dependent phosphatase-like protein [Fennellomyces sp. T-0311]|nr:Metallo-dependent phosphatase-like protein [Fennellomyces sp. T-0311]